MLNIFNSDKTKKYKYNNIFRVKREDGRYVTVYGVVNKDDKLYAIVHWNTEENYGWKLINVENLELNEFPKCTSKYFDVIDEDRNILMQVEITGFFINKERKLVARIKGSNEIRCMKLQDPKDPNKYPKQED